MITTTEPFTSGHTAALVPRALTMLDHHAKRKSKKSSYCNSFQAHFYLHRLVYSKQRLCHRLVRIIEDILEHIYAPNKAKSEQGSIQKYTQKTTNVPPVALRHSTTH